MKYGRSYSSNRHGNSAARSGRRRHSHGGFSRRNFAGRGQRINQERYISQVGDSEVQFSYVTDKKYSDFELNQLLKANLSRRKYLYPTKVQSQVIPHAIAGKDILAIASTGSGKTAAFLIPLINRAMNDRNQKCLIITPTRELAGQIKNEFDLFAVNAGLKRVLVIGGENIRRQMSELSGNPQFIIGTPGRLKDLQERGRLRLNQFGVVVLDEVDRMLDMGFVQDIKELISKLNSTRQSLFFSATISGEAGRIANTLLKDPARITSEVQSPIKNVEQSIVRFNDAAGKLESLHNLLIKSEFQKVLIFLGTKRSVDSLTDELNLRGFKVGSIHGNKSQNQRTKSLSLFKKGDFNILIATDVAARGIDVPDITHVINYDEPATYDDYIHRIGRTGRIGKKGVALTFVR